MKNQAPLLPDIGQSRGGVFGRPMDKTTHGTMLMNLTIKRD